MGLSVVDAEGLAAVAETERAAQLARSVAGRVATKDDSHSPPCRQLACATPNELIASAGSHVVHPDDTAPLQIVCATTRCFHLPTAANHVELRVE